MKAQYIDGKLYLEDKPTTEAVAWAKMRAEFIKVRFGVKQ